MSAGIPVPMNSLYSLTWGDYGSSLVSAIQLLRCQNDLVDCTLSAGGRSFQAHKIVLCAASPLLLDLLKNTPCKHPVVLLAGVNPNDLEALLEFVYRGEVSVDHSQLPSLLQAAQCLNIQGLAPQTVTKDDYATHSLQLQHLIPQHHHDQDQLIAAISTAPQQTVHAQVVDDIHQSGQVLHTQNQSNTAVQHTIMASNSAKDVIQQYLPARKRKPRSKKPSLTAPVAKVQKIDGMDSIISTPNSSSIENCEGQILSSNPHIKNEISKVETIVTMDPSDMLPVASANLSNSDGPTSSSGNAAVKSKRVKHPPGTEKPRSRSQSEQPATCPICYAVIRQSRNLRRHLELRHFAKGGSPGAIKKDKKVSTKKITNVSGSSEIGSTVQPSSNSGIANVQTIHSVHTLQAVQVKKDPDSQQQQQQHQHQQSGQQTISVTTSTGATSIGSNNMPQQVQIQTQPQIQQHQIIDQSGHITAATTSAHASAQHQQQTSQMVNQNENSDGSTPLAIAQVQTLQGHQILGNISQVNMSDFQHQHQRQQQTLQHQTQQQAAQQQQQHMLQ